MKTHFLSGSQLWIQTDLGYIYDSLVLGKLLNFFSLGFLVSK